MTFDPNTDSLAGLVSKRRIRFPNGTPDALKYLALILVDNRKGLLTEDMMQHAKEEGFELADDLPLEDFLEMVRGDHERTDRVWSKYRTAWDEDAPAESAPKILGPPYEVIYADPPWPYRNKKTGGSHTSGASQQYAQMTLPEIQALPVSDLAADRCALFLWATVPLLPDAVETLAAWGFKYKTALVWNKPGRLGMGFWFRGQVEILLLGVRGKVPPFRCQERNLVSAKSLGHSKKPEEIRDLILRAVGSTLHGAKLEMFSRGFFDGWDVFGDEVGSDIELAEGVWRRVKY